MDCMVHAMFAWNERYRLGHDEIDRQHADLFADLEQCRRLLFRGTGEEPERFTALVDGVSDHFRYEEGLLRTALPSELARHQRQHAGFLDLLADFHHQYRHGHVDTDRFQAFLLGWTSHTLVDDHRLVVGSQAASAA